jgi:hypothetical protein
LAAAAPSARADQVYTDLNTFLANVGGNYYLENFNSLPQGPSPTNVLNFPLSGGAVNGFSYSVSTSSPLNSLYGITVNGTPALSTDFNDSLTFDFTGADTTAVGGFFFLTDVNGNVVPVGSLTLTLDDGTTATVTNPSPTGFIGFTTDAPIASLTVTPGDNSSLVTLEGFYAGVAVPEPASVSLLGCGVLGLALALGRNRVRLQG